MTAAFEKDGSILRSGAATFLLRACGRLDLVDRGFEDALLSRARRLPAGVEIALEGEASEPVVLVLEGWVASTKMLRDGRRQIIAIALPMDLLMPLAACGHTAWCGVETLTPAVVSTPSIDAMAGCDTMLGAMASASRARQAERLLRIGQGTAYERIAYAVLELYLRLEAIGRVEGGSFRLPVTQQRLGEYTGLSSVHVCRTINRLAAEGVIEHSGQQIKVAALDRLAEIADANLDRLRTDIVPPRR